MGRKIGIQRASVDDNFPSQVAPGSNVWAKTDVLMTHDVCGPGTIGIFKKEFGADAKVWDREKASAVK